MLTAIMFAALASVFFYILLHKIGLVTYMQLYGCKLIAKLASCEFCICFWLNIFMLSGISIYCDNYWFIALVIISTPVTKILVKFA